MILELAIIEAPDWGTFLNRVCFFSYETVPGGTASFGGEFFGKGI